MNSSRRSSGAPTAHHTCPNMFRPLRIGRFTMKNRFVVPSMTRLRANDDHVPTEMMVQHYAARAGYGLIVTESTMIQRGYSAFGFEPGLFTLEQVEAWRKVTEAVHVKGGLIFCQLDHAGRATVPANMDADVAIVGPSAHGITSHKYAGLFSRDGKTQILPEQVRAMTTDDIAATVERFARAARNAMAAGFDGVEINAGGGHLIDQFLRDSSNTRTDLYGGSKENYARLLLQVVDACSRSIGADRVAVKLSPLESLFDMSDADPEALTRFVAQRLSDRKIAYLHVSRGDVLTPQSGANLWARDVFHGALISSLGYSVDNAEQEVAGGGADAIGFGQLSMANPDLVERVIYSQAMEPPIRPEYVCARGPEGYVPGEMAPLPVAPDDIAAEERERHGEFAVEESMKPRRFSEMDRTDRAAEAHIPVKADAEDAQEDTQEPHATEEEEETPSKTRHCEPGRQLFRPLFMGAHALKNRIGAVAPADSAPGLFTLRTASDDGDEAATVHAGAYYVERASLGVLFTPPCAPVEGGLPLDAKRSWQQIATAVHNKGGILIASLQDDGARSTSVFVKAAEDALEVGFDAVMIWAPQTMNTEAAFAPFLAAVDACAEVVGKHLVGACVQASVPAEVLRGAADTLGLIGVGFLVVVSVPGATKEEMQAAAQACRGAKDTFDEGAVLCDVPYIWIDEAERLIEGGVVDGVCFSELARLNPDLFTKVIHGGDVQVCE